MNVTIILSLIILCLVLAFFLTIRVLKKQSDENKKLREEIENQQKNIIYLYKHAQEIAVIEKDRKQTDRDIQEAKTDEEVLDIINAIVAVNNTRVPQPSE